MLIWMILRIEPFTSCCRCFLGNSTRARVLYIGPISGNLTVLLNELSITMSAKFLSSSRSSNSNSSTVGYYPDAMPGTLGKQSREYKVLSAPRNLDKKHSRKKDVGPTVDVRGVMSIDCKKLTFGPREVAT